MRRRCRLSLLKSNSFTLGDLRLAVHSEQGLTLPGRHFHSHKARLEERLQALHTAFSVEDMDIPGWRLHTLKGDRKGLWAINVSGNWRIVFKFVDGHAYVVNYEDYH